MIITEQHDFIFCISLLTHTRKEFFTNAVRLWEKMLSPGGLLLFTFLGGKSLQTNGLGGS